MRRLMPPLLLVGIDELRARRSATVFPNDDVDDSIVIASRRPILQIPERASLQRSPRH